MPIISKDLKKQRVVTRKKAEAKAKEQQELLEAEQKLRATLSKELGCKPEELTMIVCRRGKR